MSVWWSGGPDKNSATVNLYANFQVQNMFLRQTYSSYGSPKELTEMKHVWLEMAGEKLETFVLYISILNLTL